MTNVHDTIAIGQIMTVDNLEGEKLVGYGAAEYVEEEKAPEPDEVVVALSKLQNSIQGEFRLEGKKLASFINKTMPHGKQKEEEEVRKPDAIASEPNNEEDAKEKEDKTPVKTKEEKHHKATK